MEVGGQVLFVPPSQPSPQEGKAFPKKGVIANMQWKFELLMKPSAVPLTEGPVWDGEYVYFTQFKPSIKRGGFTNPNLP